MFFYFDNEHKNKYCFIILYRENRTNDMND